MTAPSDARVANRIAAVALLFSLLSAAFAGFQAYYAKQANDVLRATQANNVFVDFVFDPSSAKRLYHVRNRNSQPVANVYYTYSVDGVVSETQVGIGTIAGCSSVQINPSDGSGDRRGFRPEALYFSDPMGDAWRRDANSGALEKNPIDPRIEPRGSSGSVTPIQSCS